MVKSNSLRVHLPVPSDSGSGGETVVEVPGFEPGQAEPKSVVLPLHHTSVQTTKIRIIYAYPQKLPPCLEELLHQRAAFVLQHSAADFRPGVQQAGGEEAVASLGVGSSVDEASELRPAEGGGAHGAGFDSHIQAAVAQVLAAQGIGRGGQGYHLGMCRRICETLHHVVPPSYHASLTYDHGPYRYLVFRERGTGRPTKKERRELDTLMDEIYYDDEE